MEIAIIGGGAAAVCLLDALAQTGSTVGVTVYERTVSLWRGRPYQSDSAAVRANAPPDEMSIRSGDRHHFERWLSARTGGGTLDVAPDQWSGEVFVPRASYGEYLENAANDAIATLRAHGGWVQVVRATVTSVRSVPSGIRLETAAGARPIVDQAVLCVGGGGPADSYQLAGAPGFVADPYPVERNLAGIDRDDEVAIVGTGLTAVDAVMALAARGHRGRITMASRYGTLPAVRQRPVSHELRHFTARRLRRWARERREVGLAQLADLMQAELTAAGQAMSDTAAEIFTTVTEHPVDRLRRHLAEVDSAELGLRILQRAVPDSGQDVWNVLSKDDRNTVMDRFFRAVMSLCCPMPPRSAASLLGMIDAGQLQVLAGTHSVAQGPADGFTVQTERTTIHVNWVVNAVSAPADRVPDVSSPLVRSLVTAGLAEQHPHGGLAVDRESSRLTVDGEPTRRLFALGDLTFGSLFFTFGIPVLADRSVDIAKAVTTDRPVVRSPLNQQPQTVRSFHGYASSSELTSASCRH